MSDYFDVPTNCSTPLLPDAWVKQHAFTKALVSKSGPRKAAIYCRQSAFDLRPVGIERQTTVAADYAAQHGIDFDPATQLYIDRHRSGATMEGRDGLKKLLQAAEQGEFDDLVVEAVDRLGRDVGDLLQVYFKLKSHGVEIHAANHGPVTMRDIAMLGTMAQMDRSNLIEKSVQGTRKAAASGLLIGRCKIYGYNRTADRRSLTINRKEADVIRRAADLVVGGTSACRIAKLFNHDGIPAPAGGAWSNAHFTRLQRSRAGIFRNPLLKGSYVWGKEAHKVEIAVPELAILNAELFDRIHALIHSRRRPKKSRSETKRLLSGVLRCSCGAPMLINSSVKHRGSYSCSDMVRRGTCNAPVSTTIQIAEVDRRVLMMLRDDVFDRDRFADWRKIREREIKKRRKFVASQRGRLQEELTKIETSIELEAREAAGPYSFKSSAAGAELEYRYGKLCGQLEKLVDPGASVLIDDEEAARLHTSVEDLLLRLPVILHTPNDRALVQRLREFLPRVVIHRHADKSFTLNGLLGIPELPVGSSRVLPGASCRWIIRSFPAPVMYRRQNPEVVRQCQESAASGVFDLSDHEWAALEALFEPLERTKLGSRQHANAMIFLATSRLPYSCLPERYLIGPINDRLLKKHGVWGRMLRILAKMNSPVLSGLDRKWFSPRSTGENRTRRP